MKLGEHGRFLVNFVSAHVNGEMERWEFDFDYSGYVIDHFPSFETETPRLAARFANTIEHTYSYGQPYPIIRFANPWPMRWMNFAALLSHPIFGDALTPFDAYLEYALYKSKPR